MRLNRLIYGVGAVVAFGLGGCASIVGGTGEVISITTPPVKDASCDLANSKGKFYIPHTPGTITINRAYGDLHIKCTKPGFQDAILVVKSHTKGMAFGNIIFGGIVGAGVDMANGAAYDYPEKIEVPMRPIGAPALAAPSTQQQNSRPVAGASQHAKIVTGTGYDKKK